MSELSFLEFIGQPSIVLDERFNILYANEYAINRFQIRANLSIGKGVSFTELIQGSNYEPIGRKIVELIQFLNSEQKDLHTQRIDISPELSMQISLKKSFHEKYGTFWILTGLNVTSQIEEDRRVQIRFKEQLEVFKILFEMAPVGLAIKDFEGGFYKVNKGLCDITGYTKDELLAINQGKLFVEHTPNREEALINELIEHNSNIFHSEKKIRTADDRIRIVSETINIIRDETDQPYLVIVSYQDVTEEKHLQKKLLESRKMEEIGKLSGGIAHDFNNMLLPVTLCSDIAIQQLNSLAQPLDENLIKVRQYLEKISISAQRAKSLIQKLFQYSKSGIYELKPIFLEKEIEENFIQINKDKPSNIKLTLDLSPGEYPVLGEKLGIQQILDNLVTNAFHSMKFSESGIVAIRLFEEFDEVILEVEDSGSGIRDEELEKIFIPFYTKKDTSEGTGFGLSIVQTIVHKMNGKLRVYSKPGTGTVFQIQFPKWNKISQFT